MRAKGRPFKGGHKEGMNKLEAKYADYLRLLELQGIVAWAEFEPQKLRLAKNTFWTPDFLVIDTEGHVIYVDTKGYWDAKARVKIKAAAEKFRFAYFCAVKEGPGGAWIEEWFNLQPAEPRPSLAGASR